MTVEKRELTHERLLEVLSYERSSGKFTWKLATSRRVNVGDEAGVIAANGYRYIGIDGGKYLAHRLAWFYVKGVWPAEQVDHKNVDRSANAFSNLREANQSNNTANGKLRSTNKSGFKGVSWDAEKQKWVVGITKNYRRFVLGRFDDPAEAHKVYMQAAERMFGDFARAA
jgi:hypothetical protein